MRLFILLFSCLVVFSGANAQQNIHDEHIVNQQERMVFKSWDEDKFTPKAGFLGLNPLYWITWGLHPNYPDNDLRPLSPLGPQSVRIALSIAMSTAEENHKLHSDSIRQTALSNLFTHSAVLADADPLWILYYSSALSPLGAFPENSLQGLSDKEVGYLEQSGYISWYQQQHAQLRQRLQVARGANMERGSRILYYHRLLLEYRKLLAGWEDKKRLSKSMLQNKVLFEKILNRNQSIKRKKMSDIEIADQVIKNSKL
ncbi:hypothetical protein [Pedobacter jamesrossensis]|uniref:Uncharacterized protein n=1 Tax=Pedobacter jamesrossensis TaxID=1908238 RepID=A0ABV8NSG1_9SPHI